MTDDQKGDASHCEKVQVAERRALKLGQINTSVQGLEAEWTLHEDAVGRILTRTMVRAEPHGHLERRDLTLPQVYVMPGRGYRLIRVTGLEDERGFERPLGDDSLRWSAEPARRAFDRVLKQRLRDLLQPTHPSLVARLADNAGLLAERASIPFSTVARVPT